MSVNKNLLAFFQFQLITVSYQSITGVTYMDHFDFEERYRDVNECNPVYWHPLHLPPKCVEMYQKIIRSKIASTLNAPVRILEERENIFYKRPRTHRSKYESIDPYIDQMPNDYGLGYFSRDPYHFDRSLSPPSPYSYMLGLLERDVMKEPTAPIIGMVPHFGPVAVYQQPVSKQSEIMIKTLAKAYADSGAKQHDKSKAYMRVYKKGADGKYKIKNYEFNEDDKKQDVIDLKNSGQLVTNMKINNGEALTILQKPMK